MLEIVVLTERQERHVRPPADGLATVRAAWEYRNYNDGAHDVYGCNDVLGMAACLLEAEVWHCWWD